MLIETHNGLVLLPGGGFDRGELAIVAAARELHEETGLEATALARRIGNSSAQVKQNFTSAPDFRPQNHKDFSSNPFPSQ